MLISFGVYYNKVDFPGLITNCLSPYIQSLKTEKVVNYFFFYFDTYKGAHIRVWLEFHPEINIQEQKSQLAEYITLFLKTNPSSNTVEEFTPNQLFLNYPINSIKFFGPVDNFIAPQLAILGPVLTEKISDFALSLVGGQGPFDVPTFSKLANRLCLITYFLGANSELEETLKSIGRSTILLKYRHKLDQQQYGKIKKDALCFFIEYPKVYFISDIHILLTELMECGLSNPLDQEWMAIIQPFIGEIKLTEMKEKGRFKVLLALMDLVLGIVDMPEMMHLKLLLQVKASIRNISLVLEPERN